LSFLLFDEIRERQQWQFLWLNTRHWWVLIRTVNDNLAA